MMLIPSLPFYHEVLTGPLLHLVSGKRSTTCFMTGSISVSLEEPYTGTTRVHRLEGQSKLLSEYLQQYSRPSSSLSRLDKAQLLRSVCWMLVGDRLATFLCWLLVGDHSLNTL